MTDHPKRARGTGSIVAHQGGWWARLPVDGKSKSLGVHPTYEAAEMVLNVALTKRAGTPGASATQVTFAAFGRRVLDMREEEGIRGTGNERRTFAKYFEDCPFANKPVHEVTRSDISDMLRSLSNKASEHAEAGEKIKRGTVQRYHALVSAIFNVAVERRMRADNPCIGVKIRGAKKTHTSHDAEDPDEDQVWDWLRGDEQQAFLACPDIEPWFKALVRFAWGTGLRQGEQWNLELRDLHVERNGRCSCGEQKCLKLRERGPHVFVRYGSRGRLPPKNGLTRRTPLFGEGLAGALEWLDILPTYARSNPHKLVFPTALGNRRWKGTPTKNKGQGQPKEVLLASAFAKIGITRNIRWHDLRHTCASSLVSGSWGQRWDLIQVRDMLGHKDIKTTQRYAHISSNVLVAAGAHTPGHVTQRVIVAPTDLNQVIVTSLQTPDSDVDSASSLARGSAVEQDHVVRPIPNTSIAQEAAYELLRLFGADALKLALKLAGETERANRPKKRE